MLIPKITPYDTKIIPQMYKDGYILRAVTTEYMYWDKNDEIKKKIKKTDLIVSNEYQISISYLKNIENEQIPDYAENYKDEWIKFCYYWSEKGKTGKIRAESEKTFEIKRRFATWMSRKKETYQKTEKPSVMDIVL